MKNAKSIGKIWIVTFVFGQLSSFILRRIFEDQSLLQSQNSVLVVLSILGLGSMLFADYRMRQKEGSLYYRNMLRVLLGCFVVVFISLMAFDLASSNLVRSYLSYSAIAWLSTWFFLKTKMA